MKIPSFAAHRVAASGIFSLFCLLAILLELGEKRPLALALGGSLLSLFLFTRAGFTNALGGFLAPLASIIDLALLFCAISLTGGPSSPFVLLLPTGLALSWNLEGRASARFFVAVSLLGVAALVALAQVPIDKPSRLFPLLAMGLAAPALLAALEAAAGIPAETAPKASRETATAPPAPASAAARDRQAEILHDLRSPLSVLRVYCDLIKEAAQRGELPNPEYLANLSREIELAEKLLGGTATEANAAKKPPPPPTADLVEILGSLATAYRLSHAGRLRIEFIAERPELPIAADPVALQRAFRNVLENAIKYTAEGGEVRIRAGAAGEHAFVLVKDTGTGMSLEERARAFDYAFRGSRATGPRTPGKGLGLAITKEILEANGGKISLSSEPGYGSEVTILLPFQRGTR